MAENFEAQKHEETKPELERYIYRDNFANRKIIFECVATGILEADKMYEAATGKDPRKQNYIGCSIEKIVEENKEK